MDDGLWREAEQERLLREYLLRSREERASRRALVRKRLGYELAASDQPKPVPTWGLFLVMRRGLVDGRPTPIEVYRSSLRRAVDLFLVQARHDKRRRPGRYWVERESHPASRRRAA